MSNAGFGDWNNEAYAKFVSGDVRGAIAQYRTGEAEGREIIYLNFGIALLDAGDIREACDVFKRCIEETGDSSEEYSWLGVAQWAAGDSAGACSTWQRGLDVQYADTAQVKMPLKLFAASIILRQGDNTDAMKLLEARLEDPHVRVWPAPIGRYLLRQMSIDVVRCHAEFRQSHGQTIRRNPIVVDRYMCQAEFYFGIESLRTGDDNACHAHWRTCVGYHACKLEPERYWARALLGSMNQG